MTMTYGACGSDATGALLPFGFVRMPTSRAAPGVRRGRPRAAEARRGVKQKAWFCGRPADVIDGIKSVAAKYPGLENHTTGPR